MAAVMSLALATAHLPFSSVASTSALPLPPQTTLPSSSSAPPAASPTTGQPSISAAKKAHFCPHCPKSYSKLSKLTAHVKSVHPPNGAAQAALPKPFPCPHPGCPESFGRKDHLDVHSRVHRPESERPFVCAKAGCGKRFWTGQHKRRHEEACGVSGGSHQCPSCSESFKKDSQLRAHVALAHAPPGTKPFPCEVAACVKSFATAQKLRTHAKVHDATRYTCPDPAHDGEADGLRPSFGTWSQLQAHQKEAHPPRCHYASCSERPPFGSRKALRNHLKVHREREEDDELLGPEPASDASANEGATRGRKRRRSVSVSAGAGGSGTGTPKLKRRRGESVAGKDWHCGDVGCGKSFKTKKALETHIDTAHYALRPWTCPHAATGSCDKAYGHRHLLVRHLAKKHPGTVLGENPPPSPVPGLKTPAELAAERKSGEKLRGLLTGMAFVRRPIPCPFAYGPETTDLLATLGLEAPAEEQNESGGGGGTCDYRCSRAYDLRRHLGTAHSVVVGEAEARDVAEALKEEEGD